MRILCLLFGLLLFNNLNAQPLEPFIEKDHSGSVTFIALEFIGDTLWVSGVHRDSGEGIIWQYNRDGEVIDSTVFSEIAMQTFYELSPYGDSVVVIGTQTSGGEHWQLVMHCLDHHLNTVWTKTVDFPYDPYIFGFREFQHFDRKFIMINTYDSQFFKFDKDYNFLYKKKNEYQQLSFEPIGYTASGFVFGMYGRNIVVIDTAFNETESFNTGNQLYTPFGSIMSLDNEGYISTSEHNNTFAITRLNTGYSVYQTYPYFGHEDENPRYTYYRSIAPNTDTSLIYLSGLLNLRQIIHPVHLGSYHTNSFWVARSSRDTLQGYRYYGDSTYY